MPQFSVTDSDENVAAEFSSSEETTTTTTTTTATTTTATTTLEPPRGSVKRPRGRFGRRRRSLK
eukprot:3513919-Pyramimonas_sp.AAC.1